MKLHLDWLIVFRTSTTKQKSCALKYALVAA